LLSWRTGEEVTPYHSDTTDPRLKRLSLAKADPQAVMTADQLMSSPVLTADANWSLERALNFMGEREVSHLPVLRDNRLVGLVSDRDLLRHPEKDNTLVETVMSNRLLTARPESNLWPVAKIMLAERVHCIVIVDTDGLLQGILTSIDLLGCMTHHAPIEVWL
jgi:CBS domain-containing protein